jgi:hypothetical protein
MQSGGNSLHSTLHDRDHDPLIDNAQGSYKLTPNVGRRVTEPERQGQALHIVERKSEYNNSSKMLKPVTFH